MGNPSKKLILSLLIVSLAILAKANTGGGKDSKDEGILHGYVMDAVTKKPLSGVVVSAIVPGMSGLKELKEVLTNAEGYFRFSRLPASQVTVQFDKKGYQPCKRPNVTIKEKATVKLEISFQPDEAAASGPEVDNSEYPLLRMLETT